MYKTFILVLVIGGCAAQDFVSPPTTVKTKENNTVLLPCYLNTISNDGAYAKAVRWYKNHDLLVDSSNETVPPPERHILWENGSLQIDLIKPLDTGEYTCEILRPEPWGTIRQKHAIEVLRAPVVEPYPPTGFMEVKLGEEVRMSCLANGVPYPIITWNRQGKELKLLDSREMLVFTASDRQLSGVYECVAVNGVGEPAKAQIQLNIQYPPEIMTPRSWVHTAPGHRSQLECKVSADPQATVVWMKDDVIITPDNRIVLQVEQDKHNLLIRNVQRTDFGTYTCKAVNNLGSGEVQVQLSGMPNPGVFKRTEDKNLNSKNSYTLIWEVDSYTPIIEYNLWFREYSEKNTMSKPKWAKLTIPTEHSSGPVYSKSYTIHGLKERTIYEAMMSSRNRYGWSKLSSVLRFATFGAGKRKLNLSSIDPFLLEVREEMMTTAQMQLDGNVSLDLVNSLSSSISFHKTILLLLLLNKML